MHKNTKRRAVIAIAGLTLVGVTECTVIQNISDAATADTTQTLETQALCGDRFQNLLEACVHPVEFERVEFTVEEVEPWLHPEKVDTQLSKIDLVEVLESVGFSGHGLIMAIAIVHLESTNKIYAHNQNSATGDNSYGLFQINMIGSMGPARLEKYGLDKNEDLFDPYINAKVAYKISDGGKSWGAWTTYSKALELVG